MITALGKTAIAALAWIIAAGALGYGVNALRSGGILWIAPFPFEMDCPEKLPEKALVVSAKAAWALHQSKRVRDEAGRHGTVFVDAREAQRYAAGHLPGAVNHPYSFITPFPAAAAAKLHGFVHIFVYCDTPEERMAQLQGARMRKAGLNQIRVVQGGWEALKKLASKGP